LVRDWIGWVVDVWRERRERREQGSRGSGNGGSRGGRGSEGSRWSRGSRYAVEEGVEEAEGEGGEWVVGGDLGANERKPIESVARKRKEHGNSKVVSGGKTEQYGPWVDKKTKDGNSGEGLRGGRTATTSKPSSNRLDPVVASPLFRFRLLGVKETSSLGDTLAVLHVVANGLLVASS
jgi:hypothetical protein